MLLVICLTALPGGSKDATELQHYTMCVCVELLNRGTSGGWFSEMVSRQGLHREEVPSSGCLGPSGLLTPALRVPWAESTALYPTLPQHWQLCGGTLDPAADFSLPPPHSDLAIPQPSPLLHSLPVLPATAALKSALSYSSLY